jgi:hypothetical protein
MEDFNQGIGDVTDEACKLKVPVCHCLLKQTGWDDHAQEEACLVCD